MKNINIFEYLDYKKWLKDLLKISGHGSITKLADHLSCQRSYVSQVLNSHIQLTPDQAFALGNYSLHTDLEKEYLGLLIEFARAGTHEYRQSLKEKIIKFQDDQKDISRIVPRKNELSDLIAEEYFSSWIWSALHIATSLNKNLSSQKLAEQLKIEESYVLYVLNKLVEYDLVSFKNGNYVYKSGDLHLKSNSPLLTHFHSTWRQKSIYEFQQQKTKKGVNYTVVQTIAKDDSQKFQQELRELIQKFESTAGPSVAEVLVSFNLDFNELTQA